MSNEGGPWGSQPARRGPPRNRVGLWLLLAAALVGLIVALARAFPEAVRSRDDWTSVAYAAGFILVLSAGLLRASRGGLAQHLRHAAIWVAIVAALALGLAYRDELTGVARHVRMAFSTGEAIATADHELVIPQDDSGAYVVVGKVNGERVRFVIDTGATDTVLSPDDAARLGVQLEALRYEREAETANGLGYGAPYTAQRLEVGPIGLANFEMTINQAPMSTSLLGLSFLNRLDSFEFRKRKLILKWREGAG